ncbi:MAG: helix-turn-helix transcriptional regulator [Erythrobacter sp.]|uniref:helix-turn-helix domain-containing protein n=1 Tax=Erythrobacter sp. TaxID=1042 RepID=UPI00263996C6|nr:helix-turn-helix transcriptional regulator [Erythrobacter sp.]MDJ0977140.1 helix-turn-helix transcriptional regulator [Erythrobacter sp.]
MINRIREIRRAKSLTLADLAAACEPPTTAQTIGRLETGTRTLSTKWMDRIGAALGVDPETLVRSEAQDRPRVIAELSHGEAAALPAPREALFPHELAQGSNSALMMVMEVTAAISEYRPGDLIWLRRIEASDAGRAINRDCLVPRAGGRFVFGRLIDTNGSLVGVLPVQSGQKQQVIDSPPWIGVTEMLVRRL